MTTEHQATREEKAYGKRLKESEGMLSEAARTILAEAQSAAYGANLVRNYSFQPREYDEAMDKMRLAAADLTDREHQLLARIWLAALAAASSIDPEDSTPAGYKVDRGDLHWYYRMVSGMIETILQEKKIAEVQESAAREPVDYSDIPF